jgi:peptidoglycan hydrolase-like protein with peptidoglycan-binding domain
VKGQIARDTWKQAAVAVCLAALVASCATVDRSVVASPADNVPKIAPAVTTSGPASSVTALATSSSAAPTTTTTVAPTTTSTEPPTTTTTVPPTTTTTEALIPPPPAPIEKMRQGANGLAVFTLQQRMLDLGFWIDEVDGNYGWVTSQAVMAFQKMYGRLFDLPVTGDVDDKTAGAISIIQHRAKGTVATGDLIEVDKSRQLLFLIRGGVTLWTFNTSTGSNVPYVETDQKKGGTTTGDAVTPEGAFHVYNEFTDGWEKGQLGELYRPKYFKGGVAVHGSNSVPNYAASHGCVRLTTTAMDWMWANDMIPKGSIVVVHN